MTNPSSKVGERPKVEQIYADYGGKWMVMFADEATAYMDAQAAEIERLTGEMESRLASWLKRDKVNFDDVLAAEKECLAYKARAEAAEAYNASLVKTLKEVLIVMTGADGCNAPFDAERWSKAVDAVQAALAPAEEKQAC